MKTLRSTWQRWVRKGLVGAILGHIVMTATSEARDGEARDLTWEGVTYLIYSVKPERLELHWRDAAGQNLAQFRTVQAALAAKGRKIEFITNAGIFEPGGIPSGLHIENGRHLLPLNLREGKGNFYLQPNGVFVVADGVAQVLSSDAFAGFRDLPTLALQSGPLLLNDGQIHPAFQAPSVNVRHRSGIGVHRETGEAVFAMTHFDPATNRVNLHGFARLFLHLGCDNALFLDGDLSQAVIRPTGEIPIGNRFAAMLVVSEPIAPESTANPGADTAPK